LILANTLLVDTGFLVALFRSKDRLRPFARGYLSTSHAPLATVSPVIVESCFFLSPPEKRNLLEWVLRGALTVQDVPVADYPKLSFLIGKYAEHDPDFTDMALVWLAQESGCRRVLTVDTTDFSIYRTKSGKPFELPSWMP